MSHYSDNTLTKHEQILHYIEGLPIGTKISVRQIAKQMQVSDGTAYRAIREADSMGLVSTKERIGTVRVEKRLRSNIDQLTFGEVVNVVEGSVLGGAEGLDKTLGKFVIGAMELDAMSKYIESGSLLIVGNRESAHRLALEQGAGVLITGGFDTSAGVKALANRLGLPIISSGYDTFTVASMINRAIFDRIIKKKTLFIEDIVVLKEKVAVLKASSTIADWRRLNEETGHQRFPVVDEWNRVIGMVTGKDVSGANAGQTIDKAMTRNPITVSPSTSLASAAHIMVWEGIELLPVVDNHRKLLAVISRNEVLQAMQQSQKQPQLGETFEDLIWSGFEETRDEHDELSFTGSIKPQMSNHIGTVSEGLLSTLMTQAAFRAVQLQRRNDLILENMSTYFVRPLPIESQIVIKPTIIEVSRKFGKVDVEIYHQEQLVAKALLTAQVIDQT